MSSTEGGRAAGWSGIVLGGVTAVAAWGLTTYAVTISLGYRRVTLGHDDASRAIGLRYAAVYAYTDCRSDSLEVGYGCGDGDLLDHDCNASGGQSSRAVAVNTSDFTTLTPNYSAWILTITVYGAIMLISGGISFVLYLRHTQPAAETAE